MKCSVVVANYNNAPYIDRMVKSIKAQTYTNWELVFVDDGSTDKSVEVMKRYAKSSKYKVFGSGENFGVGAAKRLGTEKATGEVIAIVDADDALAPNALGKMMKLHAEHPEVSLIIGGRMLCDEKLQPVAISPHVKPIPAGATALEAFGIAGWECFKKSYYDQTEGFSSKFRKAVDQDICFKLEEVGELLCFEEPLYLYREHSSGISQGSSVNEAKLFHYQAVFDASKRRRKSGFQNIGPQVLLQHKRDYYQLQFDTYVGKSKKKSTKAWIRLAVASPAKFFSWKWWKELIYNLVKR